MVILSFVRTLIVLLCILISSAYAEDMEDDLVAKEFIDDNYFILELNIGGIETGEVLESYKTSYGFYISLEAFIELTLFKIEFDYNTHDAKGWFIKEENKFSLDFKNRIIYSAAKKINVRPELMLTFNNEVYVNISLIEKIFPISIYVNYANLLLEIRSSQKLPFIVNRERKEKKGSIYKVEDKHVLQREYISDDYKFLTFPIAEFNANFETKYEKDEDFSLIDMRKELTYDTILSNNFLWMDSSIFTSGNIDNRDELRIELSRVSEHGDLLGKLKATQIYVGDIVEHAGEGTGIRVSNNSLSRGSLFNKTIISGDSIPGWDVELYHNDKLLDIITVEDKGRYVFNDVKLYYGENIFEIVQYGPYGEIKREIKKYNIEDNILNDDTLNYDLQVVKDSNTIFNLDRSNAKRDPNLFLKLGTKVGTQSTIYAGVLKEEYEESLQLESEYEYTFSYLTLLFYGIQSELSYQPENKQSGSEVSVDNSIKVSSDSTMRIKPYNIGGASPEYGMELDYKTKIKRTDYTFTSSFAREENSEYKENIDALLDMQRRFGRIKAVQKFSFEQKESRRILGENFFVQRVKKFSNNAIINYRVMPEIELTDIKIDNNYSKPLKHNFHLSFLLSNRFPVDQPKEYHLEVNLRKKLNKYINYNLFTSYDTATKFGIGINFSIDGKTLLFLEPHRKTLKANKDYSADKPVISILAYEDQNDNSYYDEGEPTVNDIKFSVNGTKTTASDKNGIAIGGNFNGGKVYEVFPDYESLEDPEIVPKRDTMSVLSSKGTVFKLEYPFMRVGSVDGNMFINGKPLSKAKVILYDGRGKQVANYITDIDGFFYLPNIPVGDYYLSLSKTSVRRLKLSKDPRFLIAVKADNLFLEYLKFDVGSYLKQEEENTESLEQQIIDPDMQLKLDFMDPEIMNRITSIIPLVRPLPMWIQGIRIKSKPQKLIDYFSTSIINEEKYYNYYEVQLGSFKYYQRAIDFQNLLVGQAGHFFRGKQARVVIEDEVKEDDLFFVLKIDSLYNKSNAQGFCKEIKEKLKITCTVYQEIKIDKDFFSKNQAQIFWEYLKECKKFPIKEGDTYFLTKILDKDGGYKYQMKIMSSKNSLRNLNKICQNLNTEKTICRIASSIRLEESFDQTNYLYKFQEISDTLREYTHFVEVKQDEYDVASHDKINYKLHIGKFANYDDARKFCTDLLLEVPKNCFPIKKVKTEMQINSIDSSNNNIIIN